MVHVIVFHKDEIIPICKIMIIGSEIKLNALRDYLQLNINLYEEKDDNYCIFEEALREGSGVYGKKEIDEFITENMLKTIVIHSSLASEFEINEEEFAGEILYSNHPSILEFGGVVGVMWYASNENY